MTVTTVYLRDFPEDLHYKLKIQAARERTTIKELIIRITTQYLESQDKSEKN